MLAYHPSLLGCTRSNSPWHLTFELKTNKALFKPKSGQCRLPQTRQKRHLFCLKVSRLLFEDSWRTKHWGMKQNWIAQQTPEARRKRQRSTLLAQRRTGKLSVFITESSVRHGSKAGPILPCLKIYLRAKQTPLTCTGCHDFDWGAIHPSVHAFMHVVVCIWVGMWVSVATIHCTAENYVFFFSNFNSPPRIWLTPLVSHKHPAIEWHRWVQQPQIEHWWDWPHRCTQDWIQPDQQCSSKKSHTPLDRSGFPCCWKQTPGQIKIFVGLLCFLAIASSLHRFNLWSWTKIGRRRPIYFCWALSTHFFVQFARVSYRWKGLSLI